MTMTLHRTESRAFRQLRHWLIAAGLTALILPAGAAFAAVGTLL
jgi:hypothetical protein